MVTQGSLVFRVVHATDAFFSYSSGVFNDPTCNSEEYNHAIVYMSINIRTETTIIENIYLNPQTVVGYGKDRKFGDYWIIRNSWGDIEAPHSIFQGLNKLSLQVKPGAWKDML